MAQKKKKYTQETITSILPNEKSYENEQQKEINDLKKENAQLRSELRQIQSNFLERLQNCILETLQCGIYKENPNNQKQILEIAFNRHMKNAQPNEQAKNRGNE